MYRLAFIGFGTVGQGLAEILLERKDLLKKEYGFEWTIVAISDIIKGSIYDPKGLDIRKCLDLVKATNNLSNYNAPHKGWDSLKTIKESNADIIIEVSYTDIKTGEPGLTHVRAAIAVDKHIAMTNKGPMIVASASLLKEAVDRKILLRFEGTVMSGTPVMLLGIRSLKAAGITKLQGILNGTTNFILTKMEQGESYASALKTAQELGYAEAKPESDVEGWDAVGKVIILANTLMGASLKVTDVPCEGITKLTPADINSAAKENMKWKLIGEVNKDPSGKITASVKPTKIPMTHPLAGIKGATNALTFTTELMGEITIIGAGAGRKETGFALLTDLLDMHAELRKRY
jgi:homoserine dehydrogenase